MAEPARKRCPQCGSVHTDPDIQFCVHDGASLVAEEAEDPRIGTVLAGRFRITRRLGRGGMGVVYLAEHLHMRRDVALKLLRRELVEDSAMAARFRRESEAASRIDSPFVVTVYDFGEAEDGTLYIAMEYLRGETLGDVIARRGLIPATQAVPIAEAVALALRAAHDASVVHRDLKPDNVMLTEDGRVKVLDFSIAKILEDTPAVDGEGNLTHVRAVVGTARYMSPEAVARKKVGPAADLYALGVILFEMLVGRPPFDDPEPVLLMGMHLRVPAETLREANPTLPVPDELEQLVDALLAKDPADRPASAADLVERLGALRDDVVRASTAPPAPAVSARPSTVDATPAPALRSRIVRRKSFLPWLFAGGGAALVLVIGVGLLVATGGAGESTPEPVERAAAAGPVETAGTSENPTEEAAAGATEPGAGEGAAGEGEEPGGFSEQVEQAVAGELDAGSSEAVEVASQEAEREALRRREAARRRWLQRRRQESAAARSMETETPRMTTVMRSSGLPEPTDAF